MENNNEQTLTLNVKFKLRDILRYNMSVALKSIANKIVLGVGALAFLFFIYKMCTREVGLDIFISENIILLLVPVMIFILIPWRVWKISVSQMQIKSFAYGVTYIFSKECIVLDIGEEKDEMQWDLFVKIIETKHDFRFYVNQVSAQIIPKHNMSKEEIQKFKAIIQSATDASVCKLR